MRDPREYEPWIVTPETDLSDVPLDVLEQMDGQMYYCGETRRDEGRQVLRDAKAHPEDDVAAIALLTLSGAGGNTPPDAPGHSRRRDRRMGGGNRSVLAKRASRHTWLLRLPIYSGREVGRRSSRCERVALKRVKEG